MTHTEIQKVPIRQAARRGALLAVAAAIGMSIVAPVAANAAPRRLTNRDRSVTATEVRQALQNTSGVMQTSAQTKATSDADSALLAVTAGVTADVPKDAKRGVRLTGKAGASLSVGLPNAASAGAAQQVANGVVSYPSSNGSANAVQTNADGSVRMLTVIDNPNAPTRYDYKVTLPAGGKMALRSDGSISVVDATGVEIGSIAAPWAKDANGQALKTKYIISGNMLSQYVFHAISGVTYPVTADPSISFGWNVYVNFNKSETNLFKKYQEAGYSAWGLASIACSKIPNWALQAGCMALGTVKASQLQYAIRRASETKSCLQIAFPYSTYHNPSTGIVHANFGWRSC